MTLSWITFAFSFGSVWLLFWGLTASVPIIIHLWNRRRYREVDWAAMTFLITAVRKNARRIRIEQLILLALRTLILLLLALALADPLLSMFGGIGLAPLVGRPAHTVLVLDGSYSMAHARNDLTRFEQAKRLAAELVEQGAQGDGFTLVLMSDPPRVIVPTPAFDPQDILEEIDSLSLLHGGAKLSATTAQVQKILENARQDQPRLVDSKVCFFTDLGRTTWREIETEACRLGIEKLGQMASLVLVDLGHTGADNLAVTGLRALEPYVIVSDDITFEADVKSFGNQDHARHRVEFVVDGQPVQEQHVDVPAGGQVTVGFSHRFEGPGEHVVEVRLGTDRLTTDNHRWLSVPVRESIRVLCVSGKPGSARYVAYAMEPSETDHPRVRPEVVSEIALLELELRQYDCIFLCNVGRFGNDEAGVLYDYVSGGGGLVFFLGDQVVAQSYNLQLGGELAARRILPARIGAAAATAETSYRLDPLEYRHPIVSPFRGYQESGLLTTPIWKYFKLAPHEESGAVVALAFEGGDPAIVEERIGHGRSILVATAASSASVDRSGQSPMPWTAMASWHSFPPLAHQILKSALSGHRQQRNLIVGQQIGSSIRTTSTAAVLKVLRPDTQSERVQLTVDGEESRWIYNQTHVSGIYRAQYGPTADETQIFAVNVNTPESDLARIDPEQLPAVFGAPMQLPDSGEPTLAGGDEWSAFRLLLGGVLLLMLVESLLAWRFGNALA